MNLVTVAPLTLNPVTHALAGHVVDFANMDNVYPDWESPHNEDIRTLLDDWRLQLEHTGQEEAQRFARRSLTSLLRSKGRAGTLQKRLDDLLLTDEEDPSSGLRLSAYFSLRDGKPHVAVFYQPKTLMQFCALGLWHILGFGFNVRRCHLNECNNFFLNPPTKRGEKSGYCSRKHSELGRARTYRERERKRKNDHRLSP